MVLRAIQNRKSTTTNPANNMADNLDDLFGAFDGDGEEETEVTLKKPRADQVEVEGEASNDKHEDKNGAKSTSGTGNVDTDAVDAGGKASVYTTVMSKATVAHLRDEKLPSVEQTHQKESVQEDTNREIATGTSHDKSVRSYSAYPKNLPPGVSPPKVEPPSKPAKEYPFALDPFQLQAVSYIDKEESVLVAAHTSAGKTAVAEYAIAKSLQNGQRVVYTSPIKALSNQKYRDLQEEFKDVGLMTGDITINPTATALVMTTGK